jgi:general secretion pathway protein G
VTSRRSTSDGAFTFVETLIVLAITVILSASMGIPCLKYIERAKRTAALTQIETFRICLQSYYLDCNRYPATAQGLAALFEKPSLHPVPDSWNGPYTDRHIPDDPWGNPYVYSCETDGLLPFRIISYGADGKEGGSDVGKDIRSDE